MSDQIQCVDLKHSCESKHTVCSNHIKRREIVATPASLNHQRAEHNVIKGVVMDLGVSEKLRPFSKVSAISSTTKYFHWKKNIKRKRIGSPKFTDRQTEILESLK